MTELLDLLDSIIADDTYHNAIEAIDNDKIREISDKYFLKFKAFYIRIDRHRYSDISKHLSDKTPDVFDRLREGMGQILEDARKNLYDQDETEPQNKECSCQNQGGVPGKIGRTERKICAACDPVQAGHALR